MNEIGAFSLVLLVLIAIVLTVLYIVITKLKNNDSDKKSSKTNTLCLNELLKVASNRSSSKNDLQEALFKLVDNFPFPPKVNGQAPENAKCFLDFMDLLASHKNADAKLIVLAGKELKRKNPDYSKELDIYEQRGLTHRR